MFFGFLILPIASIAQVNRSGVARVRIDAVNESGNAVACRLETFIDTGTGRNLAKDFNGLNGIDIPYGTYDYALGPSPVGPRSVITSGRVSISQPEVVIVALLSDIMRTETVGANMGVRAGFVIIGQVVPITSTQELGGPVRIRLSPIDGQHQLDVSVDPSGQFRIYAPLLGRYVLIVVRGVDILHSEVFSFESWQRPTPLMIILREKAPTVTRLQPQSKNL
jgi:hypothetical protein